MDMIATELDAVTFRDLDSAGLPVGIEAIDVVRPNADILAVAFDADLAVVVNVAVAHATAAPDADTGAAVQAHLAVFYGPSDALAGMDRALLRGTRKLLDRDVADRHVGCCAFERKYRDRQFDFSVRRVVDEINLAAGVIDVEFVACQCALARHFGQRPIVDEQRLGLIAGRRAWQAFALLGAALELAPHRP